MVKDMYLDRFSTMRTHAMEHNVVSAPRHSKFSRDDDAVMPPKNNYVLLGMLERILGRSKFFY
jgi:hypothetical protein